MRHYSVYILLFSRSFMSNSLQPHGLQHARLPCPSPSPGACSNSCPLSQWCHPTILSHRIWVRACGPVIRNGPAADSGSCQLSRGFQDYHLQLSESVSQRTGIFVLNQRNRTPIWYVVLEAEARIGPDLVTVEAKTCSLDFRLDISSYRVNDISTYH